MSVDTTAAPEKAKEYTEDGHLKVEVSPGKIATLRELDGYESIKADSMIAGAPSPLVILKLYSLFGLQGLTVNGEAKVLPPPNNDQNIYRRAKLFSSRELTVLMAMYADEYMPAPETEEDLKNS